MAYLSNPSHSKCRPTFSVIKYHVTTYGRFYKFEMVSPCHTKAVGRESGESPKCDMIGPSHPVSNLRPIHFYVPKNETQVEKEFRLKREEVQRWNQDFWTRHNTNFVEPRRSRTVVSSRPVIKQNSATSTRSAPENFSEENRERLREENFQNWLKSKKEQRLEKQKEEQKLKSMAIEQEKLKKETAELSFALWKYKKDQQKKVNELKQQRQKEEEEQKKKLKKQISSERVSEWMHSAKFKPRPVRSNMGLLSLTATNPPSFFNPHPWIDPV